MKKKKHSVTIVEKKSVTALPNLPINFCTGFFTVMRIIDSFIVQYITGINNIYGDDNNENLCLSTKILWTGLRVLFIETINGSQWHKKKKKIIINTAWMWNVCQMALISI